MIMMILNLMKFQGVNTGVIKTMFRLKFKQ